MASTLKLWINAETGRLLANASSFLSATPFTFRAGDTVSLELHLLAGVGVSKIPYEVPFPAGSTTKVAVGTVAETPTSGQWRLSVDGTETADIPFNATPVQVQTALNAISPVSTNGGVTVAALGGGYSITWNTAGTKPPILAGSDTLAPASYEAILTLQAGDVSTREIIFVELRQNPLALATSFSPIGTPSVSIATVSAWDGAKKIVRVNISNSPKSGYWTMFVVIPGTLGGSYSAAISVGASVPLIKSTVQTALGKVNYAYLTSVIQSGESQYDFVFSTNATVTVNGTGLVASDALVGNLSLATAELIAHLGNEASQSVKLEVSNEAAGKNNVLAQVNCTIANAVVAPGAIGPVPIGTLMTETVANSRFVRKDIVDAPSTASQDILWQNLGVTQDGSDTVDAINAAASPASGNPFLTVSAADAAYLAIGASPFDQSLNTTNAVAFDRIDLTSAIYTPYVGVSSGAVILDPDGVSVNGSVKIDTYGLKPKNKTSSEAGYFEYGINGIKLPQGVSSGVIFSDLTYQQTAYDPAAIAATYATISSLSAYETTSHASSTYALLSSFDQGVKMADSPTFNTVNAILNTGGISPTIVDSTGVTFPDSTTQATRVVRENQANGSGFSTGGFNTSHYPYEVKVIDDTGTAYWVPARLA